MRHNSRWVSVDRLSSAERALLTNAGHCPEIGSGCGIGRVPRLATQVIRGSRARGPHAQSALPGGWMATAAVNGITIEYQDEGSGPPLVLVHGHPFDRSMWAPQVAVFAASGWRVIAADLRGYGKTTVVPGVTLLDTFAADVSGLLDYLGLDEVVLGGLS